MTSPYDQAQRLRELMREVRCRQRPSTLVPSVVAVVGGCAADDAASVAVRLAKEFAQQAVKVALCNVETLAQVRHADIELGLIDASVGWTPVSAPIWRQADLVLSVVSSSRESLIGTYAALKSAFVERSHLPVRLVPSHCADGQAANSLHRRISETCERFFGREIQAAPWLPCTTFDSGARIDGEPIRRLAEFVRCQVLDPAKVHEVVLAG